MAGNRVRIFLAIIIGKETGKLPYIGICNKSCKACAPKSQREPHSLQELESFFL